MSIFFEPYVMSFIIALVVSVVYYFYKRNNLKEEEEENNLLTSSVITLLLSYIVLMILYYSYKYVSFEYASVLTIPILAGGSKRKNIEENETLENNDLSFERQQRREKMMERLTIVDDDIDVDILED